MSKKKVAILMGGWSPEREVSITSGTAVMNALSDSEKYAPYTVDVTRDAPKLMADLTPKPDVAFVALHGEGGEDGVIQGFLETLGVPYTHSSILASAVGMDKGHLKEFIRSSGINTPKHGIVSAREVKSNPPLPFPFVIKPNAQGSSVGIYIINHQDDLDAFDPDTWTYGPLLVEEYIPGRELSASIILDKAYPVTELSPKSGFYDYEAKYTDGKTDHSVPANLPDDITKKAQEVALKVHQILGCKGATRSDFRYDATRKNPLYFLEINTHPGLTPLSILPESAQHEGVDFKSLCELLIEDALK